MALVFFFFFLNLVPFDREKKGRVQSLYVFRRMWHISMLKIYKTWIITINNVDLLFGSCGEVELCPKQRMRILIIFYYDQNI